MRLIPQRALVALLYLIGVLILTLLPGREISRWQISDPLLDLAHIPLFTGLTLVTLWSIVGPRGQRIALVATGIIAFAAADEWLQLFVSGRFASFADFVRDVIGVAIGVALAEGYRPLTVAWKKESHR